MTDSTMGTPPYEIPEIPIEIVSEEEMALIEAALASAHSSLSSSVASASSSSSSRSRLSFVSGITSTQFQRNARSIESISSHSKRRLSGCLEIEKIADIEDSGDLGATRKKIKVPKSLLSRFRWKRGLSITDVTASEWCEKQMEFVLIRGKPKITKAMRAGSARHTKLEEEVVKKIKVRVTSIEDAWAVKFLKFIVGAKQLQFNGLTRELPIIGLFEGVWMVGVIDEIRMPATENPSLVDTKTRSQAALPSEPQKRNARLQLMCYKYLWDNIVVTNNFPSNDFFNFFGLKPQYILPEEINKQAASSGLPAETLEDLVMHFRNTCCLLPPSHDQLILRYEYQRDHSLLGEEHFMYDAHLLKTQIHGCLEFWTGEREASYVPDEERWKCRFCNFASVCPATATAMAAAVADTILTSSPS